MKSCYACLQKVDATAMTYSSAGQLICEECASKASQGALNAAAASAHDESAGRWLLLPFGAAFAGYWLGDFFMIGKGLSVTLAVGLFVIGCMLYGGMIDPRAVDRLHRTQRTGDDDAGLTVILALVVQFIARLADRHIWFRKPPKK